MGKWIGRNLAPLLVFAAATFYFFGELAIEVRNGFLHITTLTTRSGYADLALVGFHPLFGYFLFLPLMIPVLYLLLLIHNPLDPSRLHPESQRGVPDVRSDSGVPKIKHGKFRWARESELFKQNKLRWVFFIVLFLQALLQTQTLNALIENPNLIVNPASANFQVFWCKWTIEQFARWGLGCLLGAFCTPIALGFLYVNERNRVLQLRDFPNTLSSALVVFLYYSAEFRGFLAAREAPAVFISQIDQPELSRKRLFLLGQNDSSYAVLTSKQPEDTRTIVLVRKDKLPFIVLGASLPVLEPIKSTQ